MNPEELLAFAEALADVADGITAGAFRAGLRVRTKADGTWVTDVDEQVEAELATRIRERYPDHAVFGEEHGTVGNDETVTWVIDPIDGTSNFVRGNPVFATLVAVQVDGVEQAGVVSAPALGSRWRAGRGLGAWQDDRRISVSVVDRLADAEVSTGDLRYLQDAGVGEPVRGLFADASRQRGYGDFWQHCLVASGSTDIALDADVKRWDLAAVRILVEEAGGRFTTFDGRPSSDGPTALSTNGLLHDEVLGRLAV